MRTIAYNDRLILKDGEDGTYYLYKDCELVFKFNSLYEARWSFVSYLKSTGSTKCTVDFSLWGIDKKRYELTF